VVIATFVLSFLTHEFLEIPARKMLSYKFWKSFVVGFAAPAAMLLVGSFVIINLDDLKGKFSDSLVLKNEAIMSSPNLGRGRCNEGNILNPLAADDCVLGVSKEGVDFLLIGDSQANHFTGMLDEMAKDAKIRGYDITQSQTIYLPDTRFFYKKDGVTVESRNFFKRNQALTKIIEKGEFDIVVLSGAFPGAITVVDYRLDEKDEYNPTVVFKRQFIKAIEIILNSGSVPYIVNDNPAFKRGIHKCEIINERFNRTDGCSISISQYQKQFEIWEGFLEELLSRYPQLKLIDPNRIICDDVSCVSEINGIPLYRDGSHLNEMGSRFIGKEFIRIYGNPFLEM
jgi:hypothetical protein